MMFVRLRGYLVRLWVRLRQAYRAVTWVAVVSTEQPIDMTDLGFAEVTSSYLYDVVWALSHFPDRNCAESWLSRKHWDA